jgi:hypothetical protein
MQKIKLAVLGAGHLGKIHIKCALAAEQIELVGFFDLDEKNSQTVIEQFGLHRFSSYEELLDAVDAVDIVTPTPAHFEAAKQAMEAGKHVFVEKPVTATIAEGEALLELQKKHPVKVQVGHVERFNPAFTALKDMPLAPMFIEGHRLAAFQPRGTEVAVVLDLMIHDLDLVLRLIDSPVKAVSASGVAVMSDTPDIANARIEFENGAVANLTASRISLKQMRKMRLFQPDAYISLDFFEKNAQIVRLYAQDAENLPPQDQLMEFDTKLGKKWMQLQMPEAQAVNAIQRELETFADSILEDTEPVVSLKDGFRALRLAQAILDEIEERRQSATLPHLNI